MRIIWAWCRQWCSPIILKHLTPLFGMGNSLESPQKNVLLFQKTCLNSAVDTESPTLQSNQDEFHTCLLCFGCHGHENVATIPREFWFPWPGNGMNGKRLRCQRNLGYESLRHKQLYTIDSHYRFVSKRLIYPIRRTIVYIISIILYSLSSTILSGWYQSSLMFDAWHKHHMKSPVLWSCSSLGNSTQSADHAGLCILILRDHGGGSQQAQGAVTAGTGDRGRSTPGGRLSLWVLFSQPIPSYGRFCWDVVSVCISMYKYV